MSKVSFRARQIDFNKPLPIVKDGSDILAEFSENAFVNRGVPQIPSGMEKEEENEHHFVEVIQALQLNSGADVKIPVPDIIDRSTWYKKLYSDEFALPTQLVHIRSKLWTSLDDALDIVLAEDEPTDYDMDTEDEEWLSRSQLDVTPQKFESMIDRLERGCGQKVMNLEEANYLLQDDPSLVIAVYDYWLNKRVQSRQPLLFSVRQERRDSGSNADPYVAFRRRSEKMQTRKNRKNDEQSYEKMLILRDQMDTLGEILSVLVKRESTKEAIVQSNLRMFEARYRLQDWDGVHLLEAENVARKLQRPADGIDTIRPPKESVRKRSTRKRKLTHRILNLSIRAEDASDTERNEPDADGPFAFVRMQGCRYLRPRYFLYLRVLPCDPFLIVIRFLSLYLFNLVISQIRRRLIARKPKLGPDSWVGHLSNGWRNCRLCTPILFLHINCMDLRRVILPLLYIAVQEINIFCLIGVVCSSVWRHGKDMLAVFGLFFCCETNRDVVGDQANAQPREPHYPHLRYSLTTVPSVCHPERRTYTGYIRRRLGRGGRIVCDRLQPPADLVDYLRSYDQRKTIGCTYFSPNAELPTHLHTRQSQAKDVDLLRRLKPVLLSSHRRRPSFQWPICTEFPHPPSFEPLRHNPWRLSAPCAPNFRTTNSPSPCSSESAAPVQFPEKNSPDSSQSLPLGSNGIYPTLLECRRPGDHSDLAVENCDVQVETNKNFPKKPVSPSSSPPGSNKQSLLSVNDNKAASTPNRFWRNLARLDSLQPTNFPRSRGAEASVTSANGLGQHFLNPSDDRLRLTDPSLLPPPKVCSLARDCVSRDPGVHSPHLQTANGTNKQIAGSEEQFKDEKDLHRTIAAILLCVGIKEDSFLLNNKTTVCAEIVDEFSLIRCPLCQGIRLICKDSSVPSHHRNVTVDYELSPVAWCTRGHERVLSAHP
ncbi:hypothetical protein X801_05763, partial [Opisthorchis viverrini]